jgi:hypothetical protein
MTLVSGQYLKSDGTPEKGLVTFQLIPAAQDSSGNQRTGSEVVARLDHKGEFTIDLVPDNSLVGLTGDAVYLVTENVGSLKRQWHMLVPDATPIDLNDMYPGTEQEWTGVVIPGGGGGGGTTDHTALVNRDAANSHPISAITNLQSDLDAKALASHSHNEYQLESEKGAANGYAPLDGTGKVPEANLPAGQAPVTDHGSLTGLTDDDHVQYALADGSRGSFEVSGAAAAAVSAHEAASNPHDQYLTPTEHAQIDHTGIPGVGSGGSVSTTGPYYLHWNGANWDDPQTGGTTSTRPSVAAWPEQWVVWVTATDPAFDSPPALSSQYDQWERHPDALVPVFFDDFQGTAIDLSQWGLYASQTSEWGRFDTSLVKVQNGILRLECEKDPDNIYRVSGCASYVNSRTYGRYEARVRLEVAEDLRCVILLWPTQPESWYSGGEIDFLEVTDENRQTHSVTTHYFPDADADPHRIIQNTYGADFTQWNNVGVIWDKDYIRYTLNGEVVAAIVNPGLRGPMHIGLQHHHRYSFDDNGTRKPTPSTNGPATSVMEVDWVKIWAI